MKSTTLQIKKPSYKHAGLTLIELLISMVIGIFVLLAVTSIFSATKKSYDLQNNLAEMSEVARFSIDTINWHTRMAGYREQGFADGPITDAVTMNNANPDTLTLIYEADVDCNQLATGATGRATIVFDVVDNTLRCNGIPLFDNVVDMQVFIGLDTGVLRDGVVNEYIATSISTEAQNALEDTESDEATLSSDDIRSLNINLLIRSSSNNISDTAPVLNNNFWTVAPGNDGRLYQEYSFNIAVRNNI